MSVLSPTAQSPALTTCTHIQRDDMQRRSTEGESRRSPQDSASNSRDTDLTETSPFMVDIIQKVVEGVHQDLAREAALRALNRMACQARSPLRVHLS